MELTFEPTVGPEGVEIFDPIEQRRLHIQTACAVDPRPCDTDAFLYPVDRAVQFETSELFFNQLYGVDVHDGEGNFVEYVQPNEPVELDGDRYTVGVTAPIKLYVEVEAALLVASSNHSVRVAFGEPVTVTLGARSVHEQPGTTITTTDGLYDVAHAIEYLSSALKTTTPERSFPTLRGHPPLLELGDELDVPSGLEPAETGVTISIPETYAHLYTIAPLAFYLGAKLELGGRPAIHADGHTYRLESPTFEDAVASVLKQVLFLDCVVRTEGIYDIDLYERSAVEHLLPADLTALYEASIPEQLAVYLDVPFEAVEPYVPRWCLTAYLPSDHAGVEPLPFVVNELGIVRESVGERKTFVPAQATTNSANSEVLVRGGSAMADGASFATTRSAGNDVSSVTTVEPAKTDDSVEHAWFGEDVPQGASKATVQSFRTRLDRTRADEAIQMAVVCNDVRMLAEHDELDDVYGVREDVEYDVKSHLGVTTDGLAEILQTDEYDFLHYIGHATPEGLECTDGHLDVSELAEVSVDSFFLNACDSYEHALTLVENGALAGVGTLGDVVNEHAVTIGRMMANLLNCGFPFRGAVDLVREYTLIGEQYIVVGDGATDLVQTNGGAPCLSEIESREDEKFEITDNIYPTKDFRLGTIAGLSIPGINEAFISPGRTKSYTVERQDLIEHFSWGQYPVRFDGAIYWNDGFNFDYLFS